MGAWPCRPRRNLLPSLLSSCQVRVPSKHSANLRPWEAIRAKERFIWADLKAPVTWRAAVPPLSEGMGRRCQDSTRRVSLDSREQPLQCHLCTFRDRAAMTATQDGQVNFMAVNSYNDGCNLKGWARLGRGKQDTWKELPPRPLCRSLPGSHRSAAMLSNTLQSSRLQNASLAQCQVLPKATPFGVITLVTNSNTTTLCPQATNFDFR